MSGFLTLVALIAMTAAVQAQEAVSPFTRRMEAGTSAEGGRTFTAWTGEIQIMFGSNFAGFAKGFN